MKHVIGIFVITLLIFGCSKEDTSLWKNSQKTANQGIHSKNAPGIHQEFTVSIENVSGSSELPTPFAPGVWIIQKKNSAPIWYKGQADFGDGLEGLAEDGNPGPLNESLNNHPKVRSKGVFNTPAGAGGPAPIFPGERYEFTVIAKPNDHLNFATMFVQSNDLFVAPSMFGISLFKDGEPLSGDITGYLHLWDAGTEVNEEPGVGPNQAPRQSGPNTGPDENGVVDFVNDGYHYPDVDDMLRVTITPK